MSPGPTIDARCLVTRGHPPKCTATAPATVCLPVATPAVPQPCLPCCLRARLRAPMVAMILWASATCGCAARSRWWPSRVASYQSRRFTYVLRNMYGPSIYSTLHASAVPIDVRTCSVPKKVDNMTCESSGCESRWYKNRKSSGWKYLPATAHTAMRTHAMFCTLPLPSTGGDTAMVIATHRLGYWSNQTSLSAHPTLSAHTHPPHPL